MHSQTNYNYYKPICRSLHIGAQEYAFVDQELAAERAENYLQEALQLIHSTPNYSDEHVARINKKLLTSTDLGSKDAAYLLATRILNGDVGTDYLPEDALIFFRVAAERGHAEAAYRMACCYADLNNYPELLGAGKGYFSEISIEDKALLADYYFNQAKELGHGKASEN